MKMSDREFESNRDIEGGVEGDVEIHLHDCDGDQKPITGYGDKPCTANGVFTTCFCTSTDVNALYVQPMHSSNTESPICTHSRKTGSTSQPCRRYPTSTKTLSELAL